MYIHFKDGTLPAMLNDIATWAFFPLQYGNVFENSNPNTRISNYHIHVCPSFNLTLISDHIVLFISRIAGEQNSNHGETDA